MSSKEELVNIIKEWIENDEKVKELQTIIKEYKNKKKKLTHELLSIMKTNEIDCFDINSGKIVYCKSKTKASLNKKTLIETLEKFFKEKNNKLIFLKKDNLYNHLKPKTVDEINLIEKKLNYIQTSNLEKDLPSEKFIIFGRTYMDEKNFRAVE